MAALRKASAYSKKTARPYTRKSKKRAKSYIKTVPQLKIAKFNMGNTKTEARKKFDTIIRIVSDEQIQIRDNAIESARQTMTRALDKQIQGQYYMELKVYPHHILRNNKVYSGGSKGERINTGMQQSFGKVEGRAAIVKPHQQIFYIETAGEKAVNVIRKIIKVMKPKMPCRVKTVIEKKK